jgi:hypothetical protein
MALLNLYIYLPMVMARENHNNWRSLLPLIPILGILLKNSGEDQAIWYYLLDEAMLESVALMLAFALMFLFGRGIAGDRAWQGLGIGMTLIVVALFGGCASGLILAWAEHWQEWPPLDLLLFGGSMGFAVWHRIGLIKFIQQGGFNPDKIFDDNFFLLLAPLALWLIGLPVLRLLIWG